ncbi:hypothetical protein ACW9JV_01535 [Salibacterium sp. K-3]
MDSLENAAVEGNLIITGSASGSLTFSGITVKGDVDASELEGSDISFDGMSIEGDIIL